MKRILLAALAVALALSLSISAMAATTATALETATELYVQNKKLSAQLETMNESFAQIQKTADKNIERALKNYEKARQNIAVSGEAASPPFEGTGIMPPPIIKELLQEVRFFVYDGNGDPVCNLSLTLTPADSGTQERMAGYYDMAEIETTDHIGRTTRRLAEGSYTATLRYYWDGEQISQNTPITISQAAGRRDINLTWKGKTPEDYFSTLENRLEITLHTTEKTMDKPALPAVGIMGALSAPSAPSKKGSQPDIGIIPTNHTNAEGKLFFPLPEKKGTTKLILTSDIHHEEQYGRRQSQSITIKISKNTGVVRVSLIYEPVETTVFPEEDSVAVNTDFLKKLPKDELLAKTAKLREENSALRADILALSKKWHSLSDEYAKKASAGTAEIDKKYGAKPR